MTNRPDVSDRFQLLLIAQASLVKRFGRRRVRFRYALTGNHKQHGTSADLALLSSDLQRPIVLFDVMSKPKRNSRLHGRPWASRELERATGIPTVSVTDMQMARVLGHIVDGMAAEREH